MAQPGVTSITSRSTVSPPRPESNTRIRAVARVSAGGARPSAGSISMRVPRCGSGAGAPGSPAKRRSVNIA